MKKFLLLLFTFSSLNVLSQTTLELGTKWTYSQERIGGPIDPTYIEITGDTIINGIIWSIINGEGGCSFNSDSPPLIREEGSKWFSYNVDEETESILYDFSLETGESYFVEYFGPNLPIEVRVDSTSFISINGVDRKVQLCSNPNSSNDGLYFGAQIIEGLGSTNYLFPQGNICDPQAGPLRCFESNSEFINFVEERDCDESYFSTSTSDAQTTSQIKLYPNPITTGQIINIESEQAARKIKVFDENGILVLEKEPYSKNTKIKLLNSGIYFILIETLGKIHIRKLIVLDD